MTVNEARYTFWHTVIDLWKASGQSKDEWCWENKLPLRTFVHYEGIFRRQKARGYVYQNPNDEADKPEAEKNCDEQRGQTATDMKAGTADPSYRESAYVEIPMLEDADAEPATPEKSERSFRKSDHRSAGYRKGRETASRKPELVIQAGGCRLSIGGTVVESMLSDSFKRAFGIDIIPNTHNGSYIPLCLGDPVKLDDIYDDEQERQEAYADILANYKQVQNQGDGIKSFTGILLSLMLNYYCTYLIDEPESFLHPPQAKIMGQIIGTTLSDKQQAFISTHSEDVIKGLLEVCPDRLKIVRITRQDDTNDFSILDNQKVKEVFGDPLLKYSNIMSSLFHKTVVLCESDSDCKLYSVIDSHLKQEEGRYSETLFLHCGGKHRMARTAAALLALNIDVRLIPDIDIMNDETVFKSVVETFGIDWDSIKTDYNIIVSNLHSEKERILRTDAKTAINQILDAKQGTELSKREIEAINNVIRTVSKWDSVKHSGETAVPAGDATNAYKRLKQALIDHKIYLVPVGELEGFVKEVGGHGPNWVNDVLEDYPDLSSEVYDQVKGFIGSIGL